MALPPLLIASFRPVTTRHVPEHLLEEAPVLNKWLRSYVPDGCVVHSFRHSMRDRLRAVQCPSDIIDQIGGWQTAGVGQGYGKGFELEVLHMWMQKPDLRLT